MQNIASFFVGLLFAVGLGISGMTQPEKVIGFLDFFGSWDPTLMFVMAGAMAMYVIFFRVVRGTAPVLAEHFAIPANRQIDLSLVVGSALFGIGWGLAGFCPGPALASVANGAIEVLIFVASMVAGMSLFALADRARPRRWRAARGSGRSATSSRVAPR